MLTMRDTISTDGRRFGLVFLLIVLTGVCASVLMYWITGQGPGVTPDSIDYIEAARSLLAGNGFYIQGKAMTHYPPGYPLLLGGVGLLHHGDVLVAARFLTALFFGVNLVLFGLAVQACTGSLTATGCAILLFLSSAPIILVHSMAWSESLFIMFSMAAFLLLAHHIVRPRLYLLVLASLMAGFAAVTRYAGVVLFPTIVLALLLLGNRSIKHKMRDMIAFAGIALAPLALWLLRNVMIAQSSTNREFAFHPFNLDHTKNLISTMYDFALSISIPGWTKAIYVGVTAALFLLGVALLHRKMYIKQNATSIGIVLPAVCIIFSLIYLVFLVISISFFDAETPLNHRILLPALLALTVAGISLAWSLSKAFTQQRIWYGFVLIVFFSVSINVNHAIANAVDIHNNGSGYTSRYWKHSETIAYLSDVRDVRKIYSNGPDVIRFLTGKEAVAIPAKVSPFTRRLNEDYEEQLNQMVRECREGKALIAYLNGVTWRWYLPSIEEIESTGNLPVLSRIQDGAIYGTH